MCYMFNWFQIQLKLGVAVKTVSSVLPILSLSFFELHALKQVSATACCDSVFEADKLLSINCCPIENE